MGAKRAAPPEPEGSSGTNGFVHRRRFGGQSFVRFCHSIVDDGRAIGIGRAPGQRTGGGQPPPNPTR